MLRWVHQRLKNPRAALREHLGHYELPSFPRLALDAARKLRDPNIPIAEIGELLAQDPGLSASLLRLTNSPAYGLRSEVRNVEHAVALLGRGQTESAVLAAATRHALPVRRRRGFDPVDFWRAAARRAMAAKALADVLHPGTASETFTASLLQDMAVPVLCDSHGERYGALLERWADGGEVLSDLERSELGVDHAQVGGWISQEWSFPARITDAIGAHHEFRATDSIPPAIGLVAPLRGSADEAMVEHVVEIACREFTLPQEQIRSLLAVAFESADRLAEQLV
ncbi:MAG: HDOD domain-containing protein [Myxococcales bacterium]|nr:HDOD domain-containing protein [Myxococcales bacterium]